MPRSKPDQKKQIAGGDYVSKDDASIWIEFGGVLISIMRPFGEKRVLVEMFRDDKDVQNDHVIDSATCEPR